MLRELMDMMQTNNQDGSSVVFQVVDFGLYQVIITDANGCSVADNNILYYSPQMI
jgi:hypothetical protein